MSSRGDPRTLLSERGSFGLAVFLVGWMGAAPLGCAHSEKVTPPPDSALAAVEVDESGVPFAPAPEGLLRPGGILLMQQKLSAEGLLKAPAASSPTGRLDPPTREALRAFQARHDLPETGLPSYATVETLRIDPKKVFFDALRPPTPTDQPSRDQGSVGGPTAQGTLGSPAR